jgi:hypothetical protein
MDNQGQEVSPSVSKTILGRRSLTFRAKELFAALPANGNGYLYAMSSQALSSLEIFGVPGVHTSVLNALNGESSSKELYAPQFVHNSGFQSTVVLINLEGRPTAVSLTWRDDTGQRMGQAATVTLPARGRTTISDPSIFGITMPAGGIEGYLAVSSSAANITGAIEFGDPGNSRFRTTLPLIPVGRTEALFSQVAQNETYFTGVAVINPSSDAAQVSFAVFDSNGTQVGSAARTIPSRGRLSKLLPELFSALPAMSSGYFRVSSNLPAISFAVFGTHKLTALAAIP